MNCGWPSAPAHDPFSSAELDVAAIQDLERAEQLGAEERRPPRVVGERHQRRDRRPHAGEPAEVRLEPPDRDEDARVDAVLLADRPSSVAVA